MNVYDNEAINEYRRSSGSGRKKSSRNRNKTKPIGKFEVAAFAVVIGFAIGLVVGMGIGGFPSRSAPASSVPQASVSPSHVINTDADFEIKARESLKRLESKGYDVEDLKKKYVDLEHSPGDILNAADPVVDGMIQLNAE